ncbi:MAG TPA: VWA domain-containing protein, partial [Vicinamibacterales bacterium]|nr:VWA domain-containing protein [Vicinamibacterales bacterium]
ALVWVSEGYDFTPFQASRLGLVDPNSPFIQNQGAQTVNQINQTQNCLGAADAQSCQSQYDPTNPVNNPDAADQKQAEVFADADLALELADITRAANRANTTIYTVDPRGLVGPSDIGEPVDPTEWNEYIRKTQDTMRELAEETGGLAVVNMNDYDKAFKRIDNDTSDYYVLGYYSSNPDPTHRTRKISINVLRKGAVVVQQRGEYTPKRPAAPAPPPKPIGSPAAPNSPKP